MLKLSYREILVAPLSKIFHYITKLEILMFYRCWAELVKLLQENQSKAEAKEKREK